MTHAIRFHKTGGPEVLVWEEVQVGKPGPGEARIRHTAVGLNFVDIYNRSGLYPMALPSGLGGEAAGVVEEVGSGVTDIKPGDRVAYGAAPIGSYSEARLIPAERLLKIPDGVDDKTAAAMMLKGLTTQYLIRQTYRVKAGDTILLHAAAGGVGLILSQWAKHLGATVIGTVGSDEKAKLAKAHGCDHTIVYTREDFVKRVEEITGGKKCPVVYDSVGKDTFLKSLDCLAPLGVAALFGQSSGAVDPLNLGLLAGKGSLYVTRPTLDHLRRQARESRRHGQGAVRRRQVRRGQDRGAPDLSAEGRGQGPRRSRRAQDHGLDGVSGVRSNSKTPAEKSAGVLAQPLDRRLHDGRDLVTQCGHRHRDQLLLEPEADHAVHGGEQAARGDAEFVRAPFRKAALPADGRCGGTDSSAPRPPIPESAFPAPSGARTARAIVRDFRRRNRNRRPRCAPASRQARGRRCFPPRTAPRRAAPASASPRAGSIRPCRRRD